MFPTKRPRVAAVSRILLADDQAIFRAGIARVLAGQEGITVLNQCSDSGLLLDLVASSRSCTLLLAQSLQDRHGSPVGRDPRHRNARHSDD